MKTKFLLIVLLLLLCLTGFSKTWTVTNSGTSFSPATITIVAGDSVKFNLASIHNVVEVSQSTWNANGNTALPGFSAPFGGGLILPTHLTVGTHYYVCAPHASIGMKGTIIVQNTTGIMENPLKVDILIYPNPSNGKFHLEVNSVQDSKTSDLAIYNVQGDKIFASSNLKRQISNEIDISDFPKGMYFIKIYDGNEMSEKKIIVQ
jgi:plastocyanin